MSLLNRILHSCAALLLCASAALAQEPRLERPTNREVDVVGGNGATAWRLRYGHPIAQSSEPLLFTVSPERTYFVHGAWLRLIDTANGIVIGRWRFPYAIQEVTPITGLVADIRFQLPVAWAGAPSTTVRFDPAAGNAPTYDVGALITYRMAETEAWELLRTLAPGPDPFMKPIADAARHLVVFDDMVRRDPSAPMFHLARAKLLRDAGDPRAAAAFADLSSVASSDYTEWFRIASILASLPEPESQASQIAFDKAFGYFIGHDRDPRLVDTLIARLILFLPGNDWGRTSDRYRDSYLERIYQLAPTSEATDRAWAFHADRLAEKGDHEAAAIWRERAETSSRESLFLSTIEMQLRHGRYQMLALGLLLAALLFVVSRHVKYAAQRRMHAAAAMRNQEPLFTTLLGLRYWSRRDRWSLLAIAVAGWLAMGHSWTFARVMFRSASLPIHVGSLSGFQDFTTAFPPSPERDLLYAVALQHTSKLDDAERLYRSLPQFAESWNNLGVMLARAGKADESRQAFSRALEVDASLPEAVFNSTGEARSVATQTFKKYAPDRKMIALPEREVWLRGYLGPVWSNRYLRSLLGPLDAIPFARGGGRVNYLDAAIFAPTMIGGGALGALLILSIVLLTFVRYQDVTVPSGRIAAGLEWILPGTSPAWRWAGPLVLTLWCTALLAAFFQVRVSSPYFVMAVSQAGVLRAFGYPSAYFDLNPPMALLLGAAVVLWVANAVAIWSSSRADRVSS